MADTRKRSRDNGNGDMLNINKKQHSEEVKNNTMDQDYLKYLEILSKVNQLYPNMKIDFPCFVAVGTQGTGKSTVLNRLIGRNIFPARTKNEKIDIAKTKTLIYIHSKTSPKYSINGINLDNSKEFDDNIKTLLEGANNNSCKMFAGGDIHINISGPDLYGIHLIDTPGLANDGIPEIRQNIKNKIIYAMTRNIKARILWILARGDITGDLLGNDMIKFVKANDRASIVITKPDLVGNDISIEEILTNGYNQNNIDIHPDRIFCVKNDENDVDVNSNDIMIEELSWFKSNYCNISNNVFNRCGVKNVRVHMIEYIKHTLKEEKENHREKISEYLELNRNRLRQYGPNLNLDSLSNKRRIYMECIHDWFDSLLNNLKTTRGAEIRNILNKMHDNINNMIINNHEEIQNIFDNQGGLEVPAGDISDDTLEQIIKPYLFRLNNIINDDMKLVETKFRQLISDIRINKYTRIQDDFWTKLCSQMLEVCTTDVILEHISRLIEVKIIRHVELVGNNRKEKIINYWNNIKNKIWEEVHQSIVKLYIYDSKDKIREELNNKMDALLPYLKEDENITNEIIRTESIINKLEELYTYIRCD